MITVYDVMTGNMLSFPMDDILSKRLICLKGAETDDAQSGTEGWRVFAESHYN